MLMLVFQILYVSNNFISILSPLFRNFQSSILSGNPLVSAEELGRITEIINDYLRLYLNYLSIFKAR